MPQPPAHRHNVNNNMVVGAVLLSQPGSLEHLLMFTRKAQPARCLLGGWRRWRRRGKSRQLPTGSMRSEMKSQSGGGGDVRGEGSGTLGLIHTLLIHRDGDERHRQLRGSELQLLVFSSDGRTDRRIEAGWLTDGKQNGTNMI